MNPYSEGDGIVAWASIQCQQRYDAYDPYNTQHGQSAWAINWRHQDGANFAYADGHAKWSRKATLKPENFYPGPVPDYAKKPCSQP